MEIGELSTQGASEWASPTFIIPQKDIRVCWVCNLWELNKVVKGKKISTTNYSVDLEKKSYQFFSKLDIGRVVKIYTLLESGFFICHIAIFLNVFATP